MAKRKKEPDADLGSPRSVPDDPYDPCTGLGGQRLAAEVYYYTNCATAPDFAAWWKARHVDQRPVIEACLITARGDLAKTPLNEATRTAAEMALTLFARTYREASGND